MRTGVSPLDGCKLQHKSDVPLCSFLTKADQVRERVRGSVRPGPGYGTVHQGGRKGPVPGALPYGAAALVERTHVLKVIGRSE